MYTETKTGNELSSTVTEKECEICGVWFVQTRSTQKYYIDCRDHPEQKRKQIRYHTRQSIIRCGNGRKPEIINNICQCCGKAFETYGVEKDFCSSKCKTEYHINHTFCTTCGKPMTETKDIRDTMGKQWFCSEKCKEEHLWEIARQNNGIHTCPNCGKEFIKKSTYCSRECYQEYIKKEKIRYEELKKAGFKICQSCGNTFSSGSKYCPECNAKRKAKEPRAMRKCRICGKIFSCPASEMCVPLCSDSCKVQYQHTLQSEPLHLNFRWRGSQHRTFRARRLGI